MKIKHHVIRKLHATKQIPLWKWLLIIILILALPLFYTFVDTTQIQEVVFSQNAM